MNRTEASSTSNGSRCLFAMSNDGTVKLKKPSAMNMQGVRARMNKRFLDQASRNERLIATATTGKLT